MMTSSNKNVFRVTGPLCGEFTGHRLLFIELWLLYIFSNSIDACTKESDWQWFHIGSDNDLAPNMQQTITKTNDDLVYPRINA